MRGEMRVEMEQVKTRQGGMRLDETRQEMGKAKVTWRNMTGDGKSQGDTRLDETRQEMGKDEVRWDKTRQNQTRNEKRRGEMRGE